MIFSSIHFLYYFFPAVLLLYFVLPKKCKNAVILFSSLIFYGWGEKMLVFLFMGSILTGYVLGLLIERFRGHFLSKLFLILGILVSLGLLFYFKYTDFFLDSLNQGFKLMIPLPKIALPIGISFYTFQILSYEVDVYRGDVKANRNPIDFGAYVSFFPQLIAGPIVRYSDIEKQLKERTHSFKKASVGISRFVLGLSKKVFIANIVGEIATKFQMSSNPSVLYAWLYAISFMLQIYFDFSGYSDMAIGLGKIFGFDFIENFDYPYISKSVTEFWRRWHISLGSWFRDYVYIPLGGNRKGLLRQLLNILVVWMLTGLWHGADWNFVLWGLFYAILLTFEKLVFLKVLKKSKVFSHIYVLLATLFGFVLFNGSSLSDVILTFKEMFFLTKLPFVTTETLYVLRSNVVILLIAAICSTPGPKKLLSFLIDKLKLTKVMNIVTPVILTMALILVTAFLVDGSFNPFLYFRF